MTGRRSVALAVCVLALAALGFEGCAGGPVGDDGALHFVSMRVPSVEERRMGAVPQGGLRGAARRPPQHAAARAASPLRHLGPRVPQPEVAGVTAFRRNDSSAFIIKGDTAAAGQFPWMLAIMIDDAYFCGGSLIAEQWVLTAGHCVDGAGSFVLTAGSLRYSEGTETTKQVVTATTSFRHPDYNALFVDNDIGIIRPSKAFAFNDNIRPVRLPSYAQGADMMVGSTATISGWGLTDDGYFAKQSDVLLYVDMTINDGSSCFNYYGNVWIPNKICFDTLADKKSTCNGDSGGPLVVKEADGKFTEIGLTSFGSSAGCTLGLPIAFTRVASFLEFIEDTTGIQARDS